MSTIVVYLKNMAGECLPMRIDPEQGIHGVGRALWASLGGYPSHSVRILRVETEDDEQKDDEQKDNEPPLYDGEVLNYFITIQEEYYILNLTTGFYAVCCDTVNYNHNDIVKKFMTPLTAREVLIPQDYGTSRWLRTDKIVFVPSHLKEFVAHHYMRLV